MTGGLAATTWELDGGATKTGTSVLVAAPSDHSGDGARTIAYRSTDAAGNRRRRTATVLVDTLAPVTRDDLAAGPPAHTDPVTVTLSAADEHGALPVSGVALTHYRVDAGPWQEGTSVEVTGDGEHTVSYYSTDNAGNDEAVKQSSTVSIATTPPGASSDDAPAGWTRRPVTVTLTPGARALRTTWELDGGASQTGTSVAVGAPADHSGDGAHTITYRSWAFGDVAEPVRTARSASTRGSAHGRQRPGRLAERLLTVTLSPSDTASGVAATTWSLDGGVAHSGTSVPVSGDGVHTVTYASTETPATPSPPARPPCGSTARRRRRAAPSAAAGSRHAVTATVVAGDRPVGRGQGRVPRRPGRLADRHLGAARRRRRARGRLPRDRPAGNVTSGQGVVGIDTARPAGQGAHVQGQEGEADS